MTAVVNKILIKDERGNEFEAFLNDAGEIYFGSTEEEIVASWITISKEDWEEFKKHIDSCFNAIEQKEINNG